MAKLTLSKERYSNLLKAERDLTAQVQELDKMESCGVDCTMYRQMIADALDKISNIKTHYSPISQLG